MGGTGRNILIGGLGADTLIGGGGEGILIAGGTVYDEDLAALTAIMAEWDRTDLGFHQRVAQLISNGQGDGRLNGVYVLNKRTVLGDGASNSLTNGGELAWDFLSRKDDSLSGRKPGDHVTGL